MFHFITISRSLSMICNHSHHNFTPPPFSRYGWRRIVIWLATARDSFETRRSQINQKFFVLHQQLYTQWSVLARFDLQQITINYCIISNLSFILIRGYSVCSNKKSTTISIKEKYESSVTIEGTKVICSLQGIPTERPFWSLSLSTYSEIVIVIVNLERLSRLEHRACL